MMYTNCVRNDDRNYIMTLLELIQSKNAKTAAWVAEDPTSRWAGMITEDLSHWAEYDIHTAEDYERYELQTFIYEGHKDAFGVKGRHYDFSVMTMDELRAEADYISDAVNRQMEADRLQEESDLAEFKSLVQRTIEMGAGDEETALRWLTQDQQFYHGQDVEHWVWDKGILFTDYGRELVKKLDAIVEYTVAA